LFKVGDLGDWNFCLGQIFVAKFRIFVYLKKRLLLASNKYLENITAGNF
jgi:hypothetical protein